MENVRLQHLCDVGSMVVKLGTQLLADSQRRLDAGFLSAIAGQVARLREKGIKVTIVSSGAVGAGLGELKLPKRPTDLGKLQAVAAVGQRRLMDAWGDAFAPFGLPVGQVLLTRDDVDHRTRYLNLRNTLAALQEFGAVPIINENDTISTDEIVKITFGDNDILAAMVTNAIQADLLVLLSVVDGVLDAEGRPVRLIEAAGGAQDLVRAEKSAMGKGGMGSKVRAAEMVTTAGDCLVVADGRMENVLARILAGQEVGSLFAPARRRRSSRSRWIGSVRPVGSVIIDAGAAKAVGEKNKSLLPAGIVRVEGTFDRGDVIAINGPDGRMIGRGLSNYSSEEVAKIFGKKTAEVRSLFAEAAYDEVIHRDNLVLE